MSDPYGSFEKPSPYGDAPFAGQRPPYGQPSPPPGYGQQPYAPHPQVQSPHGQPPYGQQQPPYGHPYGGVPHDPNRRPGTVLAAGIIAIVSSSLVALLSLVMVIAGIAARSWFADQVQENGTDDGTTFVVFLVVMFLVTLAMSAGGILCAVFALRRSQVARIVLVVLSGLTIVASLVSITGIFPILTLGAAIATIVLLFVGGANEWFRPKPVVRPFGQGPGYY